LTAIENHGDSDALQVRDDRVEFASPKAGVDTKDFQQACHVVWIDEEAKPNRPEPYVRGEISHPLVTSKLDPNEFTALTQAVSVAIRRLIGYSRNGAQSFDCCAGHAAC
jgi:hypothetical protein